MMTSPDAWASPDYEKTYGPRGQWSALRKLFKNMDLTAEDQEWLNDTTIEEVDGKMTDLLSTWKSKRLALSVPARAEFVSTRRAGDLICALGNEIEAIKAGTLSEAKAREVAKFRSMQLTGLRLVLDAERLKREQRVSVNDEGGS